MGVAAELLRTVLVGTVGAIALVGFGFALLRWALAPVAALVALSVATEALRDPVALEFSVGSASVRAADLAVVVLLGMASLRLCQIRSRAVLVPAALVAFVLIHLARGIATYGIQPAVNGARPWLYFAAAFAFAVSARRPWGRGAYDLVVVAGVLLAVLGLYNVAVSGIAQAGSTVIVNGALVDARSISAAGALIVLAALIIALGRLGERTLLAICVVAVTTAAVALIPHRTIWAAGLLSACVGFATWVDVTMRRSRETAYAVTGLVLIVLPAVVWAVSRSAIVRQSLAETTSDQSTFAWRTESWTNLLSQHESFNDALAGSAAGQGWQRIVNGTLVDLAPHSGYLESYLRFGVFGLLVVAAIAWLSLKGARRNDQALPASTLTALVIAQLMYGFTYQFAMIAGLMLGMVARGALETVPFPQTEAVPAPVWKPVG